NDPDCYQHYNQYRQALMSNGANGANGDFSVLTEAKKLRNLATSLFRKLETTYYRNRFSKTNNSNNVWDIFNMFTNFRSKASTPISKLISNNGKEVTESSEILQLVANEYVIDSAATNLVDIECEINEYCMNHVADELMIDRSKSVSEEEVSAAIMKVRKSREMEGASPKKIYKLFPCMIKALMLLFTIIIINMYVPQAMKTSDCYPLYKGKELRWNVGIS
ncbi:unnamed protein product, partial [Orchesella dallaii]